MSSSPWPPGNGCVLIRCDGGASGRCSCLDASAALRIPAGMAFHVAFFEAGAPLARARESGPLINAMALFRECAGVRQRAARCGDCILIASSQFGALRVPVGGGGGDAAASAGGRDDAVAEAFRARNLKRFLILAGQPAAFSTCAVPGPPAPPQQQQARMTPNAAAAAPLDTAAAQAAVDALRKRVVAFHVATCTSPRASRSGGAGGGSMPDGGGAHARAAYAREFCAAVAQVLASAGVPPHAAPPSLRALIINDDAGGRVGSALAADVALVSDLRRAVTLQCAVTTLQGEGDAAAGGGGAGTVTADGGGGGAVARSPSPPSPPRSRGEHRTVHKRMSVVHAPCMLLLSELLGAPILRAACIECIATRFRQLSRGNGGALGFVTASSLQAILARIGELNGDLLGPAGAAAAEASMTLLDRSLSLLVGTPAPAPPRLPAPGAASGGGDGAGGSDRRPARGVDLSSVSPVRAAAEGGSPPHRMHMDASFASPVDDAAGAGDGRGARRGVEVRSPSATSDGGSGRARARHGSGVDDDNDDEDAVLDSGGGGGGGGGGLSALAGVSLSAWVEPTPPPPASSLPLSPGPPGRPRAIPLFGARDAEAAATPPAAVPARAWATHVAAPPAAAARGGATLSTTAAAALAGGASPVDAAASPAYRDVSAWADSVAAAASSEDEAAAEQWVRRPGRSAAAAAAAAAHPPPAEERSRPLELRGGAATSARDDGRDDLPGFMTQYGGSAAAAAAAAAAAPGRRGGAAPAPTPERRRPTADAVRALLASPEESRPRAPPRPATPPALHRSDAPPLARAQRAAPPPQPLPPPLQHEQQQRQHVHQQQQQQQQQPLMRPSSPVPAGGADVAHRALLEPGFARRGAGARGAPPVAERAGVGSSHGTARAPRDSSRDAASAAARVNAQAGAAAAAATAAGSGGLAQRQQHREHAPVAAAAADSPASAISSSQGDENRVPLSSPPPGSATPPQSGLGVPSTSPDGGLARRRAAHAARAMRTAQQQVREAERARAARAARLRALDAECRQLRARSTAAAASARVLGEGDRSDDEVDELRDAEAARVREALERARARVREQAAATAASAQRAAQEARQRRSARFAARDRRLAAFLERQAIDAGRKQLEQQQQKQQQQQQQRGRQHQGREQQQRRHASGESEHVAPSAVAALPHGSPDTAEWGNDGSSVVGARSPVTAEAGAGRRGARGEPIYAQPIAEVSVETGSWSGRSPDVAAAAAAAAAAADSSDDDTSAALARGGGGGGAGRRGGDGPPLRRSPSPAPTRILARAAASSGTGAVRPPAREGKYAFPVAAPTPGRRRQSSPLPTPSVPSTWRQSSGQHAYSATPLSELASVAERALAELNEDHDSHSDYR